MALFHVARYSGLDAGQPEAEAEPGEHLRARALLERLQCRARERQQQRQRQEPETAAEAPEAAARRRRRPRRRRRISGLAPGSPDAPLVKRRKVNSEDAGAGSGETAPGVRCERNEAQTPLDGRSVEETTGPPSGPGPVLGGFTRRKTPKVQPFLPLWLAEPSCVRKNVTEDLTPLEAIPEVHPDLQKQLRAHGITFYFPVQAAVIPALLENTASGFLVGRGGYQPSDLCVSAPTGSGKTLAFVIPVVQALLHRVICHIRALVVLPTKELAQQVSKVFNIYTDPTPLRVALVTGQKSLAKEQESLVQKIADGYRCLADIVVATPGRLVDHIDQTPGFSLQQLRFLVIDEADRMIDSMHQSWLPRVVAAAFHSKGPADACALLQRRQPQAVTAHSTCYPQMPLQKLLFSATLTQNPEKLQRLGLYQPRLFSTGLVQRGPQDGDITVDGNLQGKYTFPMGLRHHYVPCRLSSKPLAVLHLVLSMDISRTLCFTNSRENAHRLFLLVQAFGGVSVAEFSSCYGPGQRKKILKQFEQGKIQLLISTDATARGIDIQGVELVVNYDAPQYLRTYVHRVGRTARAGKTGQAFTLLLKVQEKKFLRMLAEAGVPELTCHEVPNELLQPLVPQYKEALSQLEMTVKEEKKSKLV
ncbi:ATP-dependent RNA helicase DDX51 [Perognathus longimembris pacificus]|uniref:ATP-dependent RNA helicase DDX51 n=1 Tax=Perognathus longimembris pacificus TaxID=214514 RepID=UPI00201931CE|nr:ATP-dependent RNA helicase DDX51 [Perognathus longimembris pacificus]